MLGLLEKVILTSVCFFTVNLEPSLIAKMRFIQKRSEHLGTLVVEFRENGCSR